MYSFVHEYLIYVVGPLDVVGVLDGELDRDPALDIVKVLTVHRVIVVLDGVVVSQLDQSV